MPIEDSDRLHMADGLPMPICHFKRAGFSSIFKGIASYGYCASKSETYYGFKGNLVIGSDGMSTGITVTPANIDERESLWEIIGNIRGLLIADKGLIGEDYQAQIREHTDVNLQTPLRSNMSALILFKNRARARSRARARMVHKKLSIALIRYYLNKTSGCPDISTDFYILFFSLVIH